MSKPCFSSISAKEEIFEQRGIAGHETGAQAGHVGAFGEITQLFVLTTRTAHWFLKRGFVMGSVDDLPGSRRNLYNWQRRSQVLLKTL